MKVRPFRVDVAEEALADLRGRLARTRWPEADGQPGWEAGPPVAYLRGLAEYWRDRFDWRRVEARINALPNFVASIDGVDVHYVHLSGRGTSRLPIVLTHGWPGSFLELLEVASDLARDFDVVVPSLPGYAFSASSDGVSVSPVRIAEIWGELMSGPGLRALRRAGRRLGRHHLDAARAAIPRARRGHPPELRPGLLFAVPRSAVAAALGSRGDLRRGARALVRRGRRVRRPAGDASAHSRVCAERLARGASRLDRREVPELERLRRRRRDSLLQG